MSNRLIARLHWGDWTMDAPMGKQYGIHGFPGTYSIYLSERPTMEGIRPGALTHISSPPKWDFQFDKHERVSLLEDNSLYIIHYIAEEEPWQVWNRWHKANLPVEDKV